MFDYKTAERGPWQDGSTVPPVPGIYERKYRDKRIRFAYFDGELWYLSSGSLKGAVLWGKIPHTSPDQDLPWRGLLNKPEGL